MKGAIKLRLPNELWDEINNFRNGPSFKTRNAILVEAIHLALIEIARKMESLGIIRSDKRQYRNFFRQDLIVLNGHPAQESVERLFKFSEQAKPEYATYVLGKHIRRAIDRTMTLERGE